jgi:hypothetical protein
MDGFLFLCLYIYLKEAKGTSGILVQQLMFAATNFIIDALHWRKMGKSNLQCFFCDSFPLYCDKKLVLFVDSWSAYSYMIVLDH